LHNILFHFSEAVKVLEDSIEFASKIQNINTDQVLPLYTVLESYSLDLREDKVTDGNIKEAVMKNAKKTDEETYFIAPK
jgi:aspartyl-tRNA(Asn)/glutamyl-tRNA(Gln) amidotransferase subunit C